MKEENNLSMVEITLYSLMGLIVLIIIIALIWTKVIKKNTFSHTSYNYFSTINGRKMFLKLIKNGVLKKIYTKTTFNIKGVSIQAIDNVYIGNNNVYLISNSLTSDIKEIKNEGGSFFTLSKKNVKLKIHPEIELFKNASRDFTKIFNLKNNIKIIIPVSNKQFITNQIEKYIFVSTSNLMELIIEFESNEFPLLIKNDLEELEKAIITKNRRFFIKLKSIYE